MKSTNKLTKFLAFMTAFAIILLAAVFSVRAGQEKGI